MKLRRKIEIIGMRFRVFGGKCAGCPGKASSFVLTVMKALDRHGHQLRGNSSASLKSLTGRPCLPSNGGNLNNFQKVIDSWSLSVHCLNMSVIQARKEREKAAREELILDHAQRMLLKDGFQNLNLDTLAESVEYSKGTLYLHFKTKEDIALAVATRAQKHRADFFERAAEFRGRSRERIRAIGFACCHFANVYPDYYNVEMMLKSASFWEKADEVRQHQHAMQG